MKKTFFALALSLLAAASAKAYDDLSVEYIGWNEEYECYTFAFSVNNSSYVSVNPTSANDIKKGNCSGIQGICLGLIWPEGWTAPNDYAWTDEGEGRGYLKKSTTKAQWTATALTATGDPENYMNIAIAPGASGICPIQGEEGVLFYCGVEEEPAPGYYEIKVRECSKSYFALGKGGKVMLPEMTLIAKVGEPETPTTISVGSLLPSDEAAAISDYDNLTLDFTNCTQINGTLPFVHGCAYENIPAGLKIDGGVSYTKAGGNKYTSAVFPVDMPVDGNCYVYTGIVDGYAMFSNPAGNILPAGTPALMVEDVDYLVEGEVTIPADENLAKTATKRTVAEGGWYVKDNVLKPVNNTVFKPFRAAFPIDENATVRGFMLETADGIITLDADLNEVESIYDLQGRKLQNARRGVNIVNGQKRLVK